MPERFASMRQIRCMCLAGLLIACFASGALAQVHTLTVASGSGTAGTTMTIPISLNNPEPARGFSIGVDHDGAVLTLVDILQGSALTSANAGAGPDFFFSDTAPANGPGGTCGAVLSFAAPLDDIPIGTANELVSYQYTIAPASLPAATSAMSVVSTLGNPALETIISVAGASRVPASVPGTITVDTNPVTGLGCVLVDPCTCEFSLGWTNQGSYDSIDIIQDGTVIQTLLGSVASTTVNLISTTIGGPATSLLEVRPTQNGRAAASASCSADCPDVPDPVEPASLSCSIDPFTGIATLTWMNSQVYGSLSVSVDGTGVETLAGSAVTTTVALSAPGTYSICLDGGDECNVPFTQVCCTVVFETLYVRGDPNADGSVNISDPIVVLEYLFGSGMLICFKAADVNDDGTVNIGDVITSLNGIFGLGSLPGAPFPNCGVDPTPDALTCDSFPACP